MDLIYTTQGILITVVCATIIAGIVLLVLPGMAGLRHRRHQCLLIGPVGSGKTTIFQRLTRHVVRPTHTSMQPNVAAAKAEYGGFEVVDYPGHPRISAGLPKFLLAAKVIVIVVDALAVADEYVGARAAAQMLLSLLEDPNVKGGAGARLVVAANKRDDELSYSSNALKMRMETALTAILRERNAAVIGTAEVEGVASSKRQPSMRRRDVSLLLDDSETFTFSECCPVPVEFADISAVSNAATTTASTFSLEPIVVAARR